MKEVSFKPVKLIDRFPVPSTSGDLYCQTFALLSGLKYTVSYDGNSSLHFGGSTGALNTLGKFKNFEFPPCMSAFKFISTF